MNRTALGLAVGAGYLLGRTRKAKLALAVGSLVAGKKLNLGPKGIAELVNQQLKNNPQFKEISDQLTQELRGVGKAASGAMVERQISSLADRLHGRTARMRDELAGGGKAAGSDGQGSEEPGGGEAEDEYEDREGREAEESEDESASRRPRGEAAAKARPKPAKQGTARKTVAKKTSAARKTAGKKTAAAGDAVRGARARLPKGGGDR
ncbi:DNA primase [Streptomyces sp. NPDC046831]|uniref:DNA primase n=1 Tax=Streptomyces sp. NPDC046831 TaxID=3154805 RepID=UPI0033C9720E